jgi:NTP pyrophosphatase (non-canonical NTP hydrolase)
MGKTLAQMTEEIREVNVEKGWRPAGGGPGAHTFGDYIALLHSEVSEALEAYRDHRLEDATVSVCPHDGPTCSNHPGKPEGVGSELADVLIRLLDMCDVFGVDVREMSVADSDASGMDSFGDHLAWLHYLIANLIEPEDDGASANYRASETLQALRVVADRYGINLNAEYERKIAFNRTRSFQHGGRTLA